MTLEEFVEHFADEMTETPAGTITADTNYKELAEWGSLASLSIISMIDEEYGVSIDANEMAAAVTIEDLFNTVKAKK